tara:strand:+ start:312 stop:416 length:105 start_codon:yes stop_codon:yes gene_type:complete
MAERTRFELAMPIGMPTFQVGGLNQTLPPLPRIY